MHYAILSDVHGRREKLEAVLADAEQRGARQIVSLGDVGGDDCLNLLHKAGALAAFGNYEVSGWRRLAPPHRAWVQSWPSFLEGDSFLAVHATPWRPAGLATVEDYGAWLKTTGKSWRSLFPYLNEDRDFLWQALAELENADKRILFHGHTHEQAVWQWGPGGRLARARASTIRLKKDYHYVVGVGSVGLPEDPCWAAYALYDTETGRIKMIQI